MSQQAMDRAEGVGEPDLIGPEDEEYGQGQQAFEREYHDDHSWEQLEEDEHGNLRSLVDTIEAQRARRRRLLTAAHSARIRRGMIRYLHLIVDLSRAASLTDMRPMRSVVMFGVAQRFIRTFFDENPLSQLGIIVLRNGVAERLTELSSSPETHIERLKASMDTAGDASLQNALDLSIESLRRIPPYGHRECLILLAALATCDPGNITESIKAAKAAKVRVSVVGLAAEVHVCRVMAQETGGTYGIALGDGHLEELVLEHATPPPAAPGSSGVSLVRMGFPAKASEAPGRSTFSGAGCVLKPGAYICPRCASRVEELPAECHVCGLTLVASPHLARSYHHLFPVKPFEEIADGVIISAIQDNNQGCGGGGSGINMNNGENYDMPPPWAENKGYCYGCTGVLEAKKGGAGAGLPSVLKCPDCSRLFCYDCDAYIHEHLHNCPGCECLPVGETTS